MHMGTVFLFWIFLMPFVMLYGAYEGPKIFWLWIGGFFLTIFWLVRIGLGKRLNIPIHIRWFAAWIVVLLVSSLFGIHPLESIIGGSYRHQGVLFFFTLFLVFQTKEILPQVYKTGFTKWVAFQVIMESLIVIVDKILHFSRRPLGTIGEPNAIAGCLAFGLYWVWNMPKIKVRIRILLCLLIVSAIIATESRAGIITALVVLSGSMYMDFRNIIMNRHERLFVGSGIFLTIGMCLFFVWQIFLVRPVSLYENRIMYWNMVVQEISQKLFLGFGAETGEVVFDRTFTKNGIQLFDTMVDRSHNIFFDVLMWSGVVGLVVFLLWIVLLGRRLYIEKDWARFTAFGGWLIFASFQPVGVVHWVSLMLFL
jgi:hypothetical protein